MSEDENETPVVLNEAAVAEAGRIADWCEDRRDAANKMAEKQITVVWLLLLGGLVLLLILPRVIQFIDFRWDGQDLPPKVLERAEGAKNSIKGNLDAMDIELKAAEIRTESTSTQLWTLRQDLEKRQRETLESLTPEFSFWRDVSDPTIGPGFTVNEVARGHDQEMVAVAGGRDGRGFFLNSTSDGGWISTSVDDVGFEDFLSSGPGGLKFERVHAAAGIYFSLVRFGASAGIYTSPDGISWDRELLSADDQGTERLVHDLFSLPDGTIYAAGLLQAGSGFRHHLMKRTDQGTWDDQALIGSPVFNEGAFNGVFQTSSGSVAIFGWEENNDPETSVVPVLLANTSDGSWERIPLAVADKQLRGTILAMAARPGDQSFALVSHIDDGKFLVRSRDLRRWEKIELEKQVSAVAVSESGRVFAAGTRVGGEGDPILRLSYSDDGMTWSFVDLEASGVPVVGSVETIAVDRSGLPILGGNGILFRAVSPTEASAMAEAMVQSFTQQPKTVSPAGTSALLSRLAQVRGQIAAQETILADRETAEALAKERFDRQNIALTEFEPITQQLETALRAAEPARQLAQIATRLAVIGLLIYLVQIVVNRYRYLQRLAGFYQARAQALRLLAAQPEGGLLKGVTLSDLTSMLSPDAIGFDKSAEPPTGQMVSLLQAGLKRS